MKIKTRMLAGSLLKIAITLLFCVQGGYSGEIQTSIFERIEAFRQDFDGFTTQAIGRFHAGEEYKPLFDSKKFIQLSDSVNPFNTISKLKSPEGTDALEYWLKNRGALQANIGHEGKLAFLAGALNQYQLALLSISDLPDSWDGLPEGKKRRLAQKRELALLNVGLQRLRAINFLLDSSVTSVEEDSALADGPKIYLSLKSAAEYLWAVESNQESRAITESLIRDTKRARLLLDSTALMTLIAAKDHLGRVRLSTLYLKSSDNRYNHDGRIGQVGTQSNKSSSLPTSSNDTYQNQNTNPPVRLLP